MEAEKIAKKLYELSRGVEVPDGEANAEISLLALDLMEIKEQYKTLYNVLSMIGGEL